MEQNRIQGSRIRLISKSEIRYEGTLSSIDPVANTVSLKNVRMHGTENRPAEHPISASNALYDYIVFRGSDIKDLTVGQKPDFIDPAVVQAQPARPGAGGRSQRSYEPRYEEPKDSMYDQWASGNDRQDRRQNQERGGYGGYGGYGGGNYGTRDYKEEKGHSGKGYGGKDSGKGDKGSRYAHDNNRGGKGYQKQVVIRDPHAGKGGHKDHKHKEGGKGAKGAAKDKANRENPLATHTGMNFKATDDAKAEAKRKMSGVEGEFDFTKAHIDMNKVKEESTEKAELGYDKKKSFFDSLSCETTERQKGEPSRMTKTMRETNHKHDIETFGADAVSQIEKSFTRQRRGHHGGKGGHGHQGGHQGGTRGGDMPSKGRGKGSAPTGRGGGRGGGKGRGGRW